MKILQLTQEQIDGLNRSFKEVSLALENVAHAAAIAAEEIEPLLRRIGDTYRGIDGST